MVEPKAKRGIERATINVEIIRYILMMNEFHCDFNLVVGTSSSMLSARGVMANVYFMKGLTTIVHTTSFEVVNLFGILSVN